MPTNQDPQAVICEALRVMGARKTSHITTPTYRLKRMHYFVPIALDEPHHQALFVGEAKAFLREQGYEGFRVEFFISCVELCVGKHEFTAPTEHEAHALAVLSTAHSEPPHIAEQEGGGNLKVYVASSWRNQHQPEIVEALRGDGHEVYDFRNPVDGNHGFAGCDYAGWVSSTTGGFNDAMKEPEPALAFRLDSGAVAACDVVVMVLPCGKSAHMEMGWAAGAGKKVVVYSPPELPFQPELMYGWADLVTDVFYEVRGYLEGLALAPPPPSPVADSTEEGREWYYYRSGRMFHIMERTEPDPTFHCDVWTEDEAKQICNAVNASATQTENREFDRAEWYFQGNERERNRLINKHFEGGLTPDESEAMEDLGLQVEAYLEPWDLETLRRLEPAQTENREAERLRGCLRETNRWLHAALYCEEFVWDVQQWNAAEAECKAASELLTNPSSPSPLQDRVTELEGALEQHRQLLVNLEDTAIIHLDLPHNALPDATDNSGNPYQSQWSENLFKAAREAISPQKEAIGGSTKEEDEK